MVLPGVAGGSDVTGRLGPGGTFRASEVGRQERGVLGGGAARPQSLSAWLTRAWDLQGAHTSRGRECGLARRTGGLRRSLCWD